MQLYRAWYAELEGMTVGICLFFLALVTFSGVERVENYATCTYVKAHFTFVFIHTFVTMRVGIKLTKLLT
jgi:hypothetical protein